MTLSEAKKVRPAFVPDKWEGMRCGYWCPKCKTVYTVTEGEKLTWEFGSQFADATCPCGGKVHSVWGKESE